LQDTAVEQGIPADDEVVEAGAFVAEVAIGGPAALGVKLRADDHVHASVDDVINLLADDEALDGGVAEDGNEESGLTAGGIGRMAEVGEVEDGDAEELKEGAFGGGFSIDEADGAGDEAPVGAGQAAVGHGAVDDFVVALTELEEDAAGEDHGVGGGVDEAVAADAHALGAMNVVEAGGMHVEAHVAVGGVDEDVFGTAGDLEVAIGFELRGGLVIDDVVGAEDVVAVVDDDVAGEGEDVADAGLAQGLELDGGTSGGLGFGLGDGDELLAGIGGQVGSNFRGNGRRIIGSWQLAGGGGRIFLVRG